MAYIHNETIEALNNLSKECFQMNSFSDNLAYSLDIDLNCPTTAKIYHKNWAHKFPEFADELSDFMSNLSVRPLRLALEENTETYLTIEKIFEDNLSAIRGFRKAIIDAMKVADHNGDREVSVFLENFWDTKIKYLKQAQIWEDKAKSYLGDIVSFDKDFPCFTYL